MSNNVETFKGLLAQGIESDTSDFHVKENFPVALRISGSLVATDLVPDAAFMEDVIDDMIKGNLELREKYKKTGDLDLSYAPDGVGRFRVNIHRQKGMHAMTLRHVKSRIRSFDELSLPQQIKKAADFQRGIIIVCGTTGSGKSTTLAAMLDYVNHNFAKHIITVEDPIEYEFKDDLALIEQREVGLDTESFYSALVHALRQDPDIIMVGEMRDRESFEAALQAADTGHLVLTTLHATNATQVINRILDFYPKAEQDPIREALAVNLRATIAQRLLPRAFGGGVVPANEIMINTAIVTKLLLDGRLEKLHQAIEIGSQDGMLSFNAALLERINAGEITEQVALDASDMPEQLKMNLKGIFIGADNLID